VSLVVSFEFAAKFSFQLFYPYFFVLFNMPPHPQRITKRNTPEPVEKSEEKTLILA
jgi:hypothetical protein